MERILNKIGKKTPKRAQTSTSEVSSVPSSPFYIDSEGDETNNTSYLSNTGKNLLESLKRGNLTDCILLSADILVKGLKDISNTATQKINESELLAIFTLNSSNITQEIMHVHLPNFLVMSQRYYTNISLPQRVTKLTSAASQQMSTFLSPVLIHIPRPASFLLPENNPQTTKFTIFMLIICLIYLFIRSRPSTLSLRIQALKKCERDVIQLIKKMDCNPILLRLAWSDAATFDQYVNEWPQRGGAIGSVRFEMERESPANAGLAKAIEMLKSIKKRYRLVSWADLIQMAGAKSVELAGGPKIDMQYGRVDVSLEELRGKSKYDNKNASSNQNNSKNVNVKGKSTITTNKSYEPLSHRLPTSHNFPDGAPSADVHIRNVFYRLGFTNREAVALCGAHTIGRGFKDRSGVCPYAAGDAGATSFTKQTSIAKANGEPGIGLPGGSSWTEHWLTFDNSYFADALKPGQRNPELLWLPTDEALKESPEFRTYFLRYANDQVKFFADYAAAHRKMSELGVKWERGGPIRLEE